MQTLKKAWFPALLVLLIFILPACGPGTDGTPGNTPQRTLRIITSTPQNTRTPTITPTPLVPVLANDELAGTQIDLWYLWVPGEPDTLGEIANRFNAANDYGLTLIPRAFSQPDNFDDAVADALASSNPPDILLAHPYQYQPWAEAGLLADLTPYLESPTYGNTTFLEEMYPVFAERDLYNGQRWGFPGLFSGQVILYNQSWAQQMGFSNPPANADAFQLQACAASEANGGVTGGWMIDSTQGGAAAWLLAFAGSLEKSGQYRFEAGEVEAALAFLAGLREAGCAWQPGERYPDQDFIDRLGLFYSVSTREISYAAAAFDEANSADQVTAIGYPNSAGESVMSVYGRSYVVVASTTEN
ncbi:MAG TPA: extracellular solute-binding protein, partial [Anaerolineales bacterium]|nr:extracellular solute-binding protein [Anaerolineales bacterium]